MNFSTQLISETIAAATVRAGDPGVKPNSNGIPGISQLQDMAGGLMVGALVACVIGLLIAAATWAIGSQSSNHHLASRGKTGVLVGVGASVVIGAANALVIWGSNIGGTIG